MQRRKTHALRACLAALALALLSVCSLQLLTPYAAYTQPPVPQEPLAFEDLYSVRQIVEYQGRAYALGSGDYRHDAFYLYQLDPDRAVGTYLCTFPLGDWQYANGYFYYAYDHVLYQYALETGLTKRLLTFSEGDRTDIEVATASYLIYETNYLNEQEMVRACAYGIVNLSTMELTPLFGSEQTRPLADWDAGDGRWAECYLPYEDVTLLYDLSSGIPVVELTGNSEDVLPTARILGHDELCAISGDHYYLWDAEAGGIVDVCLPDGSEQLIPAAVSGVIALKANPEFIFFATRKQVYRVSIDDHTVEPLELDLSAAGLSELGSIYLGQDALYLTSSAGDAFFRLALDTETRRTDESQA